jgi:hypothetical protein
MFRRFFFSLLMVHTCTTSTAVLSFVPHSYLYPHIHTTRSQNSRTVHSSQSPRLNTRTCTFLSEKKKLSSDDTNEAIRPLMDLASAHFTSQALHAFVKLGIADLIGDDTLSLEEICVLMGPNTNKDALIRTLRLVVSAGILEHSSNSNSEQNFFSLTSTGGLLQTQVEGQPSMASGVQHWMENPLWNAWLHLPEYIQGTSKDKTNPDPFQRFNGMSSDYYYNAETQPQSLQYANDFVRFVSETEIESIVSCLDWSQYADKTILDIGGYDGRVLDAIALKHSHVTFTLKSLDLPQVIEGIAKVHVPGPVELIGGDVLDPSSLPPSDIIIMKHFLDRCMWSQAETIKILQTCHDKIPKNGQIVLAEAVIPDFGQTNIKGENRMEVAMDALYMLVGRERQRTESEWVTLASDAGFSIQEIIRTMSASCSLIILNKI